MIKYLRGAVGNGLGTSIKYPRSAGEIGLGTTIKYLRRPVSCAAGSGLGLSTCAAPRASAWAPSLSTTTRSSTASIYFTPRPREARKISARCAPTSNRA
jgi:hypothetical protein